MSNNTKKIKIEENSKSLYKHKTFSTLFSDFLLFFDKKTDKIVLNRGNFSALSELEKIPVSDIIIFSCGFHFGVCVCKNEVLVFGKNDLAQLGIGNYDKYHDFEKMIFFQNPEEIISVSCGANFCICVCKSGVYSWGCNSSGELGIGNNVHQSSPQKIEFFKNPEEIFNVFCGNRFCICICKNEVLSWGENISGQLGIGNQIQQSSPQKVEFFKNPEEIISFHCGAEFCVCACKNGVFSWGNNLFGQLGIGNQINQSSPQQITFFKNPEKFISISCGSYFCVCVCKNGVFGWGYSIYGQLGIGNQLETKLICNYDWIEKVETEKYCKSSPQQILFFENPEEIISLCCAIDFSICICKNGIYTWGHDYCNILGSSNSNRLYSPTLIPFKEDIKFLSFPPSSTILNRFEKKLLLILIREHLDPEECLLGKDYLPWDMFNILLKFI